MVGLGKWKLDVSLPLLRVQPVLTIEDKNGQYAFTVDASGFGISPEIHLLEAKEDENSLVIKAQLPMLNTGDVEARLNFDEVTCIGEVNVPMFGKVTVKGVKVG
ncbi:MAG: hypothetical protein GX241_06580 [Ruminococcaceae bacterium]|nr:hypothetical protein [Oscillospiraceae bacterium]